MNNHFWMERGYGCVQRTGYTNNASSHWTKTSKVTNQVAGYSHMLGFEAERTLHYFLLLSSVIGAILRELFSIGSTFKSLFVSFQNQILELSNRISQNV